MSSVFRLGIEQIRSDHVTGKVKNARLAFTFLFRLWWLYTLSYILRCSMIRDSADETHSQQLMFWSQVQILASTRQVHSQSLKMVR